MHYVVAYDVEEDRNRNHLARLLLDYGDRVQFSVFEMDLDAGEARTLADEAAQHIGPRDSLRFYPICAACRDRIEERGQSRVPPGGDSAFIV